MTDPTVEGAIESLREEYRLQFREPWGLRARFVRWAVPVHLRPEVQQDWIIVQDFAKRASAAVVRNALTVQGNPAQNLEVVTVAQAIACLDAARETRSFASQWLYVNTADELLPLVAPEEDLELVANRLGAWDASLPPGPKKVLDGTGMVPQVAQMRTAWKESRAAPAPGGPPPAPAAPHPAPPPAAAPSKPVTTAEFRTSLHNLQQVRAQCWNEANHQIAFMGSLWLWAGLGVFVALAISVFIAERWAWITAGDEDLRFRFLSAALLGFFGGALSAFLSARDKVVAIPKYQLLAIYSITRMLIGAAGSFVVVLSILAFPLGELTTLVRDNILAFLIVAIAAGFSERLFVDALEKAATNLSTVSKIEEKGSPAGGKEDTAKS